MLFTEKEKLIFIVLRISGLLKKIRANSVNIRKLMVRLWTSSIYAILIFLRQMYAKLEKLVFLAT